MRARLQLSVGRVSWRQANTVFEMRLVRLRGATICTALLLLAACESRDRALQAPEEIALTARGLGPVPLCATLDSVGALLGARLSPGGVRDSVFTGEDDSRWPGKLATLAGGGTATFESSWVDSARVWRISTDAGGVVTERGLRVGASIGTLPAGGRPVGVELPEGRLVLVFRDSVAALVDSAAERDFHARYDSHADPLRALPAEARVEQLIVTGDCRSLRPAS